MRGRFVVESSKGGAGSLFESVSAFELSDVIIDEVHGGNPCFALIRRSFSEENPVSAVPTLDYFRWRYRSHKIHFPI